MAPPATLCAMATTLGRSMRLHKNFVPKYRKLQNFKYCVVLILALRKTLGKILQIYLLK